MIGIITHYRILRNKNSFDLYKNNCIIINFMLIKRKINKTFFYKSLIT